MVVGSRRGPARGGRSEQSQVYNPAKAAAFNRGLANEGDRAVRGVSCLATYSLFVGRAAVQPCREVAVLSLHTIKPREVEWLDSIGTLVLNMSIERLVAAQLKLPRSLVVSLDAGAGVGADDGVEAVDDVVETGGSRRRRRRREKAAKG
ncbi:hypothetical protein MGYG_01695 [Nannizzia gypsea CBS 118893]|uniref:Uncharacterized protein n=1 Tax=Arthroderma gypseum (strain ATCC MYA-4604 / CBS 118893) TaxID=535722 RepID=E5R2L6_ARTGP|nr:hypothetical protein MGYG_01695 [Nannizzia gypsea CBS 118893]EFQ98674.1 hypothetical protein MGYG_01695 [Nannizzia gypsea CBS 118893]